MVEGLVIKAHNSYYYVQTEKLVTVCRLRGRFKKDHCYVVTGDRVEFELLDDNTGIIERCLPRTNLLQRPIVANIDQVVLTFAAVQPNLHPLLLNRFLVNAEYSNIKSIIICVNKIDLLNDNLDNLDNLLDCYTQIGYSVIKVSAKQNIGIDLLRTKLCDKTTVFAGPSGVGKSTLLNALDPTLALVTGELSNKIKRGKNTTMLAQLIPFSGKGFIVDTPGFSSTEFTGIGKLDLAQFFPEFEPFIGHCKYNTCKHDREPMCAIKKAVEIGTITLQRYEAYLNILSEINDRKREY
jgi:ribosome biogenesis GTPase